MSIVRFYTVTAPSGTYLFAPVLTTAIEKDISNGCQDALTAMIDIRTGVVLTDAVDQNNFIDYHTHPVTGVPFPGLQLPFWAETIDMMRRGSKLMSIDPRVNWVATRADWHLRLRPGTDTALGMAMLNVIIEEDLYDHDFVDKWCYGFEQLAERVKEMPAEKAAEICDLDANQIRVWMPASSPRPPASTPRPSPRRSRGAWPSTRSPMASRPATASWPSRPSPATSTFPAASS